MESGLGGACTYRDFGISDEEWQLTIKSKNSQALPFSSGPSGGSMGIYHRPISIGTGMSARAERNKLASTDSTVASAAFQGPGQPAAVGSSGRLKRGKAPAWRQRQKPWAPSIFAGPPDDREAAAAGTGRGGAGGAAADARAFRHSGRDAARSYSRPRHAQLDDHGRGRPDAGHVMPTCPPRRAEMRPDAC